VLAYGLFPSLLVVGPVAQYDEVEATLEGLVRLDRRRLLDGGFRMLSGLAKVFVGAYPLTWSADILVAWRYNSMPRLWLGLIAYGWYFYLNFSGYSDLAIGAGRWLGADIRPNFNRPYLQTSMTDFWNSWHISLSAFMRRNVFIPLGGVRARRQHMAIVVTMMAIALWHDITWSAALFGAYHSAGLLAHRFVEGRRPARSGRGLRVVKAIAVFVYFVLSLPLLSMTVPNAMSLYRALIFGGRLS
jgi:D-alanyl-lipoteichoic acid acyltransferase DltB (MBOAT superfamily)